ncbi:acyl transferase 4 [Cornus florida]|uniref:acyl transferase 4 n=1 Tax=Cornus florida TaxID=4283 RepID=UPI0028A1AADA|nr:acyl transferase 4 [Cornus florida]
MDFCVVRSSRGLVPPSGVTPSGTLDLSVIDRLAVLRCNARTLHVFRHGVGAVHDVIRNALSKALIPYYPLAGRLNNVSSQSGQLIQIECSGEGVWFVEASANCTLESVNYFDHAPSIPYDMLLPDHPTETTQATDALVQMQVTQFACDGFVIGLVFCHSICDGLGAAQFLNAVGELARGLHHPTIAPAWCRDFLPPPPQPPKTALPTPPPPPLPNYGLEHAIIDITADQIKQLKQEFQDSTGGQTCSSFEIVAATLWIHRTRAIHLDADDNDPNTQLLKLVFFANCRQLILNPPLPQGFYGNCFFPVTVSASSQTLTGGSGSGSSSIVDVVKLIQEAKTRLADEFGKWTKQQQQQQQQQGGEQLKNEDGQIPVDPFAPPLLYTTLFISEWGRLGFNQIDYGWGPPVHVVPIQGSSIIPVGIVGSLPSPKKGIRLMTWCVQKPHLQPFLHYMDAQFQMNYP